MPNLDVKIGVRHWAKTARRQSDLTAATPIYAIGLEARWAGALGLSGGERTFELAWRPVARSVGGVWFGGLAGFLANVQAYVRMAALQEEGIRWQHASPAVGGIDGGIVIVYDRRLWEVTAIEQPDSRNRTLLITCEPGSDPAGAWAPGVGPNNAFFDQPFNAPDLGNPDEDEGMPESTPFAPPVPSSGIEIVPRPETWEKLPAAAASPPVLPDLSVGTRHTLEGKTFEVIDHDVKGIGGIRYDGTDATRTAGGDHAYGHIRVGDLRDALPFLSFRNVPGVWSIVQNGIERGPYAGMQNGYFWDFKTPSFDLIGRTWGQSDYWLWLPSPANATGQAANLPVRPSYSTPDPLFEPPPAGTRWLVVYAHYLYGGDDNPDEDVYDGTLSVQTIPTEGTSRIHDVRPDNRDFSRVTDAASRTRLDREWTLANGLQDLPWLGTLIRPRTIGPRLRDSRGIYSLPLHPADRMALGISREYSRISSRMAALALVREVEA